MNDHRLNDLKRFYSVLNSLENSLGGTRQLSECTGRLGWPTRGIYFFYEPDERRTSSGDGNRIVRIGTHALKSGSGTKLWNRLSQHRGSARTRGGNHRGSIFRLIVGAALIDRDHHDCKTWGQGNSAPREIRDSEVPLERLVSNYVGDMPFLWLAIDDDPGPDSLRGFIERNAIALVSNFDKSPIDSPSENWLGHCCNRERVRKSGLWNSNHVNEEYDPAFLDELERLSLKMDKFA